ncbi:putative RING finger protein C2A9.04c [Camellia lanceoleosa]|uniref:RING finger protein C2A9.04c n=1 Tax=Camellia lanceoleosa TaxID=1840588 RepID=A0ACC0G348_9ERIC|nr:putative RING finger protein C2A9.04c [Camellia lanceoleosa]
MSATNSARNSFNTNNSENANMHTHNHEAYSREKSGNASRNQTKQVPEEGGFTCTICMDTMKEESSIKCGHIFGKACILKEIRAHKKCPTCKKQVPIGSIRRIYLP